MLTALPSPIEQAATRRWCREVEDARSCEEHKPSNNTIEGDNRLWYSYTIISLYHMLCLFLTVVSNFLVSQ